MVIILKLCQLEEIMPIAVLFINRYSKTLFKLLIHLLYLTI